MTAESVRPGVTVDGFYETLNRMNNFSERLGLEAHFLQPVVSGGNTNLALEPGPQSHNLREPCHPAASVQDLILEKNAATGVPWGSELSSFLTRATSRLVSFIRGNTFICFQQILWLD